MTENWRKYANIPDTLSASIKLLEADRRELKALRGLTMLPRRRNTKLNSHNHEIIVGLQREKKVVLEENKQLRAEREHWSGTDVPALNIALTNTRQSTYILQARIDAALAALMQVGAVDQKAANARGRVYKALRGEKP